MTGTIMYEPHHDIQALFGSCQADDQTCSQFLKSKYDEGSAKCVSE